MKMSRICVRNICVSIRFLDCVRAEEELLTVDQSDGLVNSDVSSIGVNELLSQEVHVNEQTHLEGAIIGDIRT